MRYSVDNYVPDATLATTGFDSDIQSIENIKTLNTLERFVAEATSTTPEIEITLDSAENIDLVAVAGLKNLDGNVTITLDGPTVINTATQQPVFQKYIAGRYNAVSTTVITIQFTASIGEECEVGAVFAGSLSDDLKPETYQVTLESGDPASLTRAQTPETFRAYTVQRIDFTTQKQPYSTERTLLLPLLNDGWGESRFWYWDEECIFNDEVLLAVMDSQNIVLDPAFSAKTEPLTNSTLGIVEVF